MNPLHALIFHFNCIFQAAMTAVKVTVKTNCSYIYSSSSHYCAVIIDTEKRWATAETHIISNDEDIFLS